MSTAYRKILVILATLLSTVSLAMFSGSSPANAASTQFHNRIAVTGGSDEDVYATVNYTRDAGGKGFQVSTIVITCADYSAFNSVMQLDGDGLVLRNQNGAQIYYANADNSDVTNHCSRTFTVNAHPGSATSMVLYYSGKARINLKPDASFDVGGKINY